jgi:sec-independent protein translocase protein TatB
MFDIAPTELMLVAVVALVVIGPKDLPKAMRFVGHWVAKGRAVMGQFRSGFDTMVREAELQEMEKKWAAENERIMREHAAPFDSTPNAATPIEDEPGEDAPPVMVSPPVMIEHPSVAPATEPEFALEPDAPPAAKTPKPRKPRAKAANVTTGDSKAAS